MHSRTFEKSEHLAAVSRTERPNRSLRASAIRIDTTIVAPSVPWSLGPSHAQLRATNRETLRGFAFFAQNRNGKKVEDAPRHTVQTLLGVGAPHNLFFQ